MMEIRLGDEAKHYRMDELTAMVSEISALEEADRGSMGAKDSRLLGLFLAEKTKVERQRDAAKPAAE